MKLTDAELALLCDKSSHVPELVKLYRDNDFLAAYAMHTDWRVQNDPHDAIGGAWEEYGILMRDFLISQGLRPEHKFLDFGCGTGRLARKIVPYLNVGNYIGIDISPLAIDHANALARREGWEIKNPLFEINVADLDLPPFHFGWAFSVFNHLPTEEVDRAIGRIEKAMYLGGKFLFSYLPTPLHVRTGLKQFKHPLTYYKAIAFGLGWRLTEVDWPGRQRILRATRC